MRHCFDTKLLGYVFTNHEIFSSVLVKCIAKCILFKSASPENFNQFYVSSDITIAVFSPFTILV